MHEGFKILLAILTVEKGIKKLLLSKRGFTFGGLGGTHPPRTSPPPPPPPHPGIPPLSSAEDFLIVIKSPTIQPQPAGGRGKLREQKIGQPVIEGKLSALGTSPFPQPSPIFKFSCLFSLSLIFLSVHLLKEPLWRREAYHGICTPCEMTIKNKGMGGGVRVTVFPRTIG